MKKGIIISAALLAMSAAGHAQEKSEAITASGKIQEKNITAGKFDAINVSGSIKVILTSGAAGTVRATAAENIMPRLDVSVDDNTLNIGYKSGASYRDTMTTVYVPASGIETIDIAGASSVCCETGLKAKELEITLTGASRFKGEVQADELDIKITGTSACDIKAACREAEIDITGNGCFNGNMTVSDNIEVETSGSAHVALQGESREMKLDMNGYTQLEAVKFKVRDITGTIGGNAKADVTNTGRLSVTCSGNSSLTYDNTVQINDSKQLGSAIIKARTRN